MLNSNPRRLAQSVGASVKVSQFRDRGEELLSLTGQILRRRSAVLCKGANSMCVTSEKRLLRTLSLCTTACYDT